MTFSGSYIINVARRSMSKQESKPRGGKVPRGRLPP